MGTVVRALAAIVVFVAAYVVLTFHVAPLLTSEAEMSERRVELFPVLIVLTSAGKTSYAVTRLRDVPNVTGKAERSTFLLPPGTAKVTDQDGDSATYTAEQIFPGRERIRLKAQIGDYSHEVEYEANDKQVFPLKDAYTAPQLGVLTIPASALLAALVFWVTRRRRANKAA